MISGICNYGSAYNNLLIKAQLWSLVFGLFARSFSLVKVFSKQSFEICTNYQTTDTKNTIYILIMQHEVTFMNVT